MNFAKITTELTTELGVEKLAELAMCRASVLEAIATGRREPTYAVGDRLIRMHDSMREMKRRTK